jgi:hypothetical protein
VSHPDLDGLSTPLKLLGEDPLWSSGDDGVTVGREGGHPFAVLRDGHSVRIVENFAIE